MDYYKDTTRMTNSRFWGYMECAAKQKAKDEGKYDEGYNQNFHLGHYIEAGLLGAESTENADRVHQKNGKKYKAFADADLIVENALNKKIDFSGEQQKIVEFELSGYKWKGKLDLFTDRVRDIKTTRDSLFAEEWNPIYGQRIPTYIKWHYHHQMALYAFGTETIDKGAEIIALSKKAPFHIEIINFPEKMLEESLYEIIELQPKVFAIANGEVDAKPCMNCDYCREFYPIRNHIAEMYFPLTGE